MSKQSFGLGAYMRMDTDTFDYILFYYIIFDYIDYNGTVCEDCMGEIDCKDCMGGYWVWISLYLNSGVNISFIISSCICVLTLNIVVMKSCQKN